MNKNLVQTIVNVVLLGAVIALFVLHFVPAKPKTTAVVVPESEKLPIAIINTDSILKQYTMAQEAYDKLMTKQENARVQLSEKDRKLQSAAASWQKEAEDFQRKLDAGAFLSRERAESEQQRLLQKQQSLLKQQQDLEALEQQLSNDYLSEMQTLNQQLQDTIVSFLAEYNADGRFHVIINEQALLYKVDGYDITPEVVQTLNARYTPTK